MNEKADVSEVKIEISDGGIKIDKTVFIFSVVTHQDVKPRLCLSKAGFFYP